MVFKDTAVMGAACRDLWAHPKVLDVLEQILGPEIVGHGTWNIRVKIPKHGPEVVGWHQVSKSLNRLRDLGNSLRHKRLGNPVEHDSWNEYVA